MNHTVPEEITIAGMTIKTVVDNTLKEKQKALGKADYASQTIFLDLEHQTKQSAEQTYIHEMIHFIFHYLYLKERDDEKLVDNIAQLLYQALKSAKNINK